MGKRILFADDTRAVRATYTRVLENAGYTVDVVVDGEVAMEKLDAGQKYDLVLTDQ